MYKMLKRWVIISNSGTCKIFQQGPDGSLNHVIPNLHLRDILENEDLDKQHHQPGLAQSSHSTSHMEGGRHAFEPHTPYHDVEKGHFYQTIVSFLNAHQADIGTLTLVITPPLWGFLRKKLDSNLLNKVGQVIEKDLVKAPLNDIIDLIGIPKSALAHKGR